MAVKTVSMNVHGHRIDLAAYGEKFVGDNDYLAFGDGEDVTMKWDGTDFHIAALANNTVLNIGDGTLSFDIKLFGSAAGNYVLWDASSSTMHWGAEGAGISQVWYTDVTDCIIYWSNTVGRMEYRGASGQKTSIRMYDDCGIDFGSVADITIKWDTTPAHDVLIISALTADTGIQWGEDDAGIDQFWYGDTSGAIMIWDQDRDTLDFRTGTSILMSDSCAVKFGGGSDITMLWDGIRFRVAQLTAGSEIYWGIDGAGITQVWWGDTADAFMYWDQTNDRLWFRGASHLILPVLASGTTQAGDIWLDTTDNKIHFYNGSAEKTVTDS